MNIKKEQKIKAQEWVVMFDGQIKKVRKRLMLMSIIWKLTIKRVNSD